VRQQRKNKKEFKVIAVILCVCMVFLSGCSYSFGDAFSSDAEIEGSGQSVFSESSREESKDSEEGEAEPESREDSSKTEESSEAETAPEMESSEESELESSGEESSEEVEPESSNVHSSEDSQQEESKEESKAEKEEDGTLIGTTAKGYDIVVKDGITYVDGVVIVNKTYTLPADYAPGFTGGTYKAFQVMQADATKQGIHLEIISGFRSYETQRNTYNGWVNRYGKEYADTISARPGHSEHQSGLAMDVNSLKFAFAETKEGRWLAENCWKYGFVIRYPEGKEDITGYQYEPWHIRYLGKELAKKVYDSGLCSEEYFGITSQY